MNILTEADKIVNGERNTDYGSPIESFNKISVIASILCNKPINPSDCVKILIAVKQVRESFKHKEDNLMDLCGYAQILNDIEEHLKLEKQ